MCTATVSGIAHYLEDEGLSTVVVALVREHAEKMHPPRALDVPFILGRPFGEPDNPALQKLVLRQAFALLEAQSGPVLGDADVPKVDNTQAQAWVCPVSFAKKREESDDLGTRVEREIAELRSWYELGVERRGRTTVGLSPVPVDESAKLIAQYLREPQQLEQSGPVNATNSLRWWASDLKAYYWEAITAQPGNATARSLEDWLWMETAAGELLLQLREKCMAHTSEQIRDIGLFMVGDIEWQHYVESWRKADAG